MSAKIADAEIISSEEEQVSRFDERQLFLVFLLLTVLLLALGGRVPGIRHLAALLAAMLLFVRIRGPAVEAIDKAAILLLSGLYAVLALGVIQLLPLPLAVVELFSPNSAVFYREQGWHFARISVDAGRSLLELSWYLGVVLYFHHLCLLRPRVFKIAGIANHESSGIFVHRAFVFVTALGVLSACIAIFHHTLAIDAYLGMFKLLRSETRAHYPFTNPNHLAVLLEMSLPCTAFLFWKEIGHRIRKKPPQRIKLHALRNLVVLGLSLLLMVSALFLTASRAGIGLNLLSLVFYGIFLWGLRRQSSDHKRQKRRKRAEKVASFNAWLSRFLLIVTCCLLFVAGISIFLGDQGFDLIERRVQTSMDEGVDLVRRSFMMGSIKALQEFPAVGAGMGCWRLVVPPHLPAEVGAWTLDYAHNDFLQFAVEVGILGYLFLLPGVIYLIYLTLKQWPGYGVNQRAALLASSLALMLPAVHSGIDFPFQVPALLLIYLLMLSAHIRLLKGESAVSEP